MYKISLQNTPDWVCIGTCSLINRTFLGRNLDFLSNPSFLANDFLGSSICWVQVSFSSTVTPSNRDFDTHSIVEFPIKIGGMLTGGFLLEISMTSLLLEWGVTCLIFLLIFWGNLDVSPNLRKSIQENNWGDFLYTILWPSNHVRRVL